VGTFETLKKMDGYEAAISEVKAEALTKMKDDGATDSSQEN
jgi:hypothetical protein